MPSSASELSKRYSFSHYSQRGQPSWIYKKHERKARQTKKIAKEKIKKASFLYHPLIGCEREIGAQNVTKPVRTEHQGLIYTSQMRKQQLHRFEPWPDEYSIKHVLRNKRSGVLIASAFVSEFVSTFGLTMLGGYRGGESSVSWVLSTPYICKLTGTGYASQT